MMQMPPEDSVTPFETYYEWLKEFVSDPVARREIERFNASDARYRSETSRVDGWESDPETRDALQKYRQAGYRILEKHGWPRVAELVRYRPERRKDYSNILLKMNTFSGVGKWVMEGGWPDKFPDLIVDVDDRETVRELIRRLHSLGYFTRSLTVSLDTQRS